VHFLPDIFGRTAFYHPERPESIKQLSTNLKELWIMKTGSIPNDGRDRKRTDNEKEIFLEEQII
jgi:hypothetical protein